MLQSVISQIGCFQFCQKLLLLLIILKMSNYENQYSGVTPVVDEYGNPIRSDERGHRTHTSEYGNPTHQTNIGYGTGGFDTTTHQGMSTDATVPTYGSDYRNDQQQNQGLSGMLHRSRSNSSSSVSLTS